MIIEIENLKKSFKDVTAVNGVSFGVEEGGFFAFLGVNGAGKSTTINIISGVLAKDEGKVEICGMDVDKDKEKIKSEIGIVFQNSVLDKKLTPYENIKYRAGLYGIYGDGFKRKLEELDSLLDLKDILKRPVQKLSGGQKRRIDIARALVHNPKILILDEPTTGLDPKTRLTVWGVVDKLRRENGLTVFLTTHYMEEAAAADYVVIIDAGSVVAEGTPHDLKTKYASDFIKIYNPAEGAEKYLAENGCVVSSEKDYLLAEFKGTQKATELISSKPELFTDYEVLKGNMDNVFLKVTGKNLAEV